MTAQVPDPLRAVLREDLRALMAEPLPVISLLTVLQTGWPHIAYLGPGELLALDDQQLGLAVWDGSRSTSAAVQTGRATLQTILAGTPTLLRCRIEDRGVIEVEDRPLRALLATVVDAATDVVPYATLTTATTFEPRDPAAALARWQATRRALARQLAEGSEPAP